MTATAREDFDRTTKILLEYIKGVNDKADKDTSVQIPMIPF